MKKLINLGFFSFHPLTAQSFVHSRMTLCVYVSVLCVYVHTWLCVYLSVAMYVAAAFGIFMQAAILSFFTLWTTFLHIGFV